METGDYKNAPKYEGTIGNYIFRMVDDNSIEVWNSYDDEYPHAFIYLKEGYIKNEKDFHYEIMAWASRNVI